MHTNASKSDDTAPWDDFRVSRGALAGAWGGVGVVLGAAWVELGVSCIRFGPILVHLEAVLKPSRGHLGLYKFYIACI